MRLPKIILEGDDRLVGLPAMRSRIDAGIPVVGWREWAGLPALGIAWVEAKIDTGARSSALHVNSVEAFEASGRAAVRFDVIGEAETVPWHEALVADKRMVRSSNGESELRFVIRTELALAGRIWPVDLTLTNRERMELPMLVGREALAGRVLVDPDKPWIWGQPVWRDAPRRGRPGRLQGSGRRQGDRS
jgi:hypothetical protein